MAKKKNQDGQEAADDSPEVAEAVEQPKADEVPISVPSAKWRVTLSSSTPVQFPSLEVEAVTQDEAKAAFDKANGISGSDHPYTFEQV